MEVIARLAADESLGNRVMKVDHAGEHGAVRIYRAQLVSGDLQIRMMFHAFQDRDKPASSDFEPRCGGPHDEWDHTRVRGLATPTAGRQRCQVRWQHTRRAEKDDEGFKVPVGVSG